MTERWDCMAVVANEKKVLNRDRKIDEILK